MTDFGFDSIEETVLPFYDVPALKFIATTLSIKKPAKDFEGLINQIQMVDPKKLQESTSAITGRTPMDNNQAYMMLYAQFMNEKFRDKLNDYTLFEDDEYIKLEGYYFKMNGMPSEARLDTYKRHWHESIEMASDEIFRLYPTKLKNKFKTLRNKVYNSIIPKYAICVQKISSQAIYITPKANILPLMIELDQIEQGFQELGNEVQEAYNNILNNPALKKFIKTQELVFRQPNYFDMQVRYVFEPVKISASNLNMALNEAMSGEISKATQKHLDELGQTATNIREKYRKRMLESMSSHMAVVESKFIDELMEITDVITQTLLLMKATKKGIINASVVKALSRLEKKAEGIGFKNVAKTSALTKKAVQSIRSGKKADVTKYAMELAKHMRIPIPKNIKESDDVKDILITATSKMNGVMNPRSLALKRRIAQDD